MCSGLGPAVGKWKTDDEFTAATRTVARCVDAPAVSTHQLARHMEAQSQASIGVLLRRAPA